MDNDNRYGPHDPDSESSTHGWITVWHNSKSHHREQVPLPPALREQRHQINDRAANR